MAMIIREYIDGNFYHEITESTESSNITENIDDEISDGIDMTEADSQHNIDPDSIISAKAIFCSEFNPNIAD